MRRLLLLAVLLGCVMCAGAAKKDDASLRFNYFVNDWNVLGLKDYERGARVTPDNAIQLAGRNVVVRVRYGALARPLTHAHTKLLMDGWLPIIEIAANDGPIRYEFTYWATPMPDVKDWRKAFDWPTEGENFMVWVRYKATNVSNGRSQANVDVDLDPKASYPTLGESPPEPVVARTLHKGTSVEEDLAPGASFEGAARFAFFPVENVAAFDKEDYRVWLQRTIAYWKGVESKTARIEVPCQKSVNALRFAHVTQLIASDHGVVHGGEGFYDTFYIRDGAYQIMEYEEAGLWGAARTALDEYLHHQLPDGRFESQGREWDSNGQAPWAFMQYYRMTKDRPWLEKAYPLMRNAAHWTMKARREAPDGSPYAGLLPASFADGECLWDGKHHIVGYDLWNLRGMLCTAEAAHELGMADDEAEFAGEANEYRAAIDAAWKRTGLAYLPPSWENEGTDWGNLETLWPTPVLDPADPRVAATVQRVRKEAGGGFIEGTMHWLGVPDVIHPYAGVYSVMADLARDKDEQVTEDFYWYLLHSSSTNGFPEGIFFKRNYAWGETIPHVTGACNFAFLFRHMLVHEQGDELHLLKAIPDWWLGNGKEIRIDRLPTYFGKLSLRVRGAANGVSVKLSLVATGQTPRIVLHLPSDRRLLKPVPGVTVVTRAPQSVRWDFPTVIERYHKLQGFEENLTTGKPVECSSGTSPELANDGIRGSVDGYWSTDIVKAKDPEPWWQVDMQKETTLRRVVVVGFYGDSRYYGFTVDVSNDGKSWRTVADRRNNTELSTRNGYTCEFAPVKARFLRVTMTGNSANTGRHLTEVMAFER